MLARGRPPTGLAFVIVQHLDPNHESMLAQLLDRHTELKVRQCEGGERIEGDTVFIIPPGRGLVIQNGVLELTQFIQPRGLRRPIDDFFLSLAVDQQANAACVILSGTGADGTTGLRAVKEHGGVCVVQQPETARYDGMPSRRSHRTVPRRFRAGAGDIVDCLTAFFRRRAARARSRASSPTISTTSAGAAYGGGPRFLGLQADHDDPPGRAADARPGSRVGPGLPRPRPWRTRPSARRCSATC